MKQLLITLALLFVAIATTQAQLSGFVETNRDAISKPEQQSYGAGLQYLLYYDYYFLPGINAGLQYEVGKEGGRASWSFPVRFQARYYFLGRHSCSGGIYTEANAGVQIQEKYIETSDDQATEAINRPLQPLASVGLGCRTPMSYDFGFHVDTRVNGSQVNPTMRFRLGYTF